MAHYVNNKDLYTDIVLYQKYLADGDVSSRGYKEVYERIFIAMELIAKNFQNKSNLRNYSYDWLYDMRLDAVINCITKLENFNTTYTNPFAYYTQIAKNSIKNFIRENKRYEETHIGVDFYDAMRGGDDHE